MPTPPWKASRNEYIQAGLWTRSQPPETSSPTSDMSTEKVGNYGHGLNLTTTGSKADGGRYDNPRL